MSIDADAILTCIREVLNGDIGSIRTVAAGTIYPADSADRAAASQMIATKIKPRYHLDVVDRKRLDDNLPVMSSVSLRDLEITITTWHNARHSRHKAASRDLSKATAIEHGETIIDAMEWPGNLTSTAAAAATGIIPGSCEHLSTAGPREYPKLNLLETVHKFSAIAQLTRAVS